MIRIGFSKDVHPLEEGRPFILGGIKLDHYKGAVGHSDADCLLHAIAEAILGAVALGDLGKFFPDNNPIYKGYDSGLILQEVYNFVKKKGYEIINIDCMVSLEKPRLRPHIDEMRQHIADLMAIEVDRVSIKATTFEGLGEVGREEMVLCEAIVLMENDMLMML